MSTRREIDAFLGKLPPIYETLNAFAEELDKHQIHCDRSKLAGKVIAATGTVISIVGGGLAIASLGASLILIPVGAAIGTAGATIGGSAFLADKIISKQKLDAAQKLWKELLEDPICQEFVRNVEIPKEFQDAETLSKWQKFKRGVKETFGVGTNVAKPVVGVVKTTRKVIDAVDEPVKAASASGGAAAAAGRAVFRNLSVVGKAFLIGGVVIDGVFLPLTIYDIVQAGIDVHRATGSPAGDTLRCLAKTIKDVEDIVRERGT